MNLVYVAPHAVSYVTKSTQGFIPVALYDPGATILEGEFGTNGRDKFVVLKPGIFAIENGVVMRRHRTGIANSLTRPRPLE